MNERDEWAKRRNEALSYYPDVARFGSLAEALTEALAEMGSSLTASPPFHLDEPVFSPFNDHPDARGRTVPEFATVRAQGRKCDVSIAFFQFPLGMYGLTFFDETLESDGLSLEGRKVVTGDLGTVITEDLSTVALVIRRALEDGADLFRLAQASGAIYEAPLRLFRPLPSNAAMRATVKRMLDNVRAKLDSTPSQDQESAQRVREVMDALKRRHDQ